MPVTQYIHIHTFCEANMLYVFVHFRSFKCIWLHIVCANIFKTAITILQFSYSCSPYRAENINIRNIFV